MNTRFLLLCAVMVWVLVPIAGFAGNKPEPKPIIIMTDPESAEFLKDLGSPLLEAAGLSKENSQFHILLDSALNAMALPNGHLVLNSGLILATEDRDEVAAVLAHEIAHLASGHHIQLTSEMRTVSLTTLIATMVGVAAGTMAKNSDITQAAIVGGSATAQSAMFASIREKELQADRLAILYLNRAGFNPASMATFLERILREQRGTDLPAPYLLTHPVSDQRVMEVRQMVKQTSSSPRRQVPSHSTLFRIQAKLIAGTETDPDQAAALFQRRIATNANDFPARYGLAIARRYAGRLPEAITILEPLIAQNPRDPYLLRERGLTRLTGGEANLAEKDFRQALKLMPKSEDFQYQLAESLKDQNQWQPASQILRRLTVEDPQNASYQYLLGLVEGKQGNLGHAHLAMGRYFALTLEKESAIWHFSEALAHFPAKVPEQNIARAELKRAREIKISRHDR